jgi:hypothetical protein
MALIMLGAVRQTRGVTPRWLLRGFGRCGLLPRSSCATSLLLYGSSLEPLFAEPLATKHERLEVSSLRGVVSIRRGSANPVR